MYYLKKFSVVDGFQYTVMKVAESTNCRTRYKGTIRDAIHYPPNIRMFPDECDEYDGVTLIESNEPITTEFVQEHYPELLI